MRWNWNGAVYVLCVLGALIVGSGLDDTMAEVLGFAGLCWLGGWTAAELFSPR